jgi:hypothetical protein
MPRSGFGTRQLHFGFMVDNVTLGEVSVPVCQLSPATVFPPGFHALLSVLFRFRKGLLH